MPYIYVDDLEDFYRNWPWIAYRDLGSSAKYVGRHFSYLT